GTGANVYLASAELAAVAAILGRLPSVEEYIDRVKNIGASAAEIYRCSNFDQIDVYKNAEDIANKECEC
ncbi:MAG: hypothetical protein KAQ71_04335, partial [Desulfobulbaceae bacterium]|nr:hypothetical protein [Desulfobulbaceae bacterium]